MDAIGLPKGIKRILKQISEKNRAAYVAGPGVREAAAGTKILRWTVVTDAELALLARLFPEEKRVEEGEIPVFFHVLEGTLREYLDDRLVTADAFAYDGVVLIDPWDGLEDACAERIRTVRDARELLNENPLSSLDLIEYAAFSGFCMGEELKYQLVRSGEMLRRADKKTLTLWFQRVITSPYAGQALRYLRDCNLLSVVVGERIFRTMNKNEKQALDMLIKGIDGTLPILPRRLTIFYMGFLKKRDFEAMAYLDYDAALLEREAYAHKHLADLHFIKKKKRLKWLLYEQGLENYEFLESIAKIQSKIYELDAKGIFARHVMLQEIREKGEAVFIEELAIKETDLLENGIVDDLKRAESILALLPYYVHKWPKFNTKQILLDQSKKIRRSRWKEIRLKHGFLRG